MLNNKALLTEEKKNTAKALAKLNEATNDVNRLEQLQLSNQEINQKMQLKD